MSRIPEKVESILFTYPKIFNYYIIVSINQYPTLLHRITQGWIVYEKKIYIYISVSSIHSRLAARFRLRNDIGFPRFLSLLLPDYFLRVTVPWPWVTARWWISLPPRVCESSRDSVDSVTLNGRVGILGPRFCWASNMWLVRTLFAPLASFCRWVLSKEYLWVNVFHHRWNCGFGYCIVCVSRQRFKGF